MSYGSGDEEFRILVIGKTGNGKSTLCNALLGQNKFTVGRGGRATTFTAQYGTANKDNKNIKVIDTPDVTSWGFNEAKVRQEIAKWRLYAKSPSAVVLAVRCDVRYTAQELDIYRTIIRLWEDDSIKDNLVVAFTFGDFLDRPLEKQLNKARTELKSVLADAGRRYFVFNKNNKDNVQEVTDTVMDVVQREKRQGEGLQNSHGPLRHPCTSCILLVVILCLLLVFISYTPPFVDKNYFLHPSIDFGAIWAPVVIAAIGVIMLIAIVCCRLSARNRKTEP
ncbi:GTPase IMAP family member 9-like [Littorina saxatilis]|uniref:AIG1-type G domain-containing protein n=1 Tax=Littorina saxatilis TaxID=31220 RepID=A0AAN9BFN7_9CAEN